MKNKRPKKPKRITVNMLFKRWEEYDITKEELILLINEQVLPVYDFDPMVWVPAISEDADLGAITVVLSKLEKSEDEILRTLRPSKFKRKPEEKNDAAEPEPDEEPQQVSEPERKLEQWEIVAIHLRTEEKLSKRKICERLERQKLKHSDLRTCQRHLAALFTSKGIDPTDKRGRPKKAKKRT